MGILLGKRRARHEAPAEAEPAEAVPLAGAATAPPRRSDEDCTIDLRDDGWTERLAASVRMSSLHEELRARRAREEAASDLHRLRDRHWSADRVIEEGRIGIDFWEHHEADPYAVLSLLPGATLDEAAAARRRIAQQCHPDRLPEGADVDEALRRMIAANAAYDRLRRALRRV